jgi:hypothetical protein
VHDCGSLFVIVIVIVIVIVVVVAVCGDRLAEISSY